MRSENHFLIFIYLKNKYYKNCTEKYFFKWFSPTYVKSEGWIKYWIYYNDHMQIGLVSVIIPIYNRIHTIRRALDSIKMQRYRPIEVVIIDDASTDDIQIFLSCYEWGDLNVQILRNFTNLGIGRTRNRGMELAKGEFLAFLDSDDEWTRTDKISMQVDFLEKNSEYGFVSTGWQVMNKGVVDIQNFCFIDDNSFRKIALKHYPAHTSTWIFRSHIFSEIGWFWDYRSEDYEYLLRIGTITKCFSIPIITERYHNSLSGYYQSHIFSSFFFWLFICIKYSLKYDFFLSSFFDRIRRWFIRFLKIIF